MMLARGIGSVLPGKAFAAGKAAQACSSIRPGVHEIKGARWYLQFPISYRELERMFADRGVAVDHTTLYR